MIEKNHLDLVQEFLQQQKDLRLQQSLSIGIRNFEVILKSKSKESMQGIELYLLEMMKQNLDNKEIVALCKNMIAIVEERMSKLD